MKVRKLLAGLLASAMIVSSLGANTTAFASEITPKETVEESSETEVVEETETEEDKNVNDSSKLSDGKDTSKTEAVDDKEEVSDDEALSEESADSSEEVEESEDDKKDDASLSDAKASKDADTKDESALEEDAEEEDEEASEEDEEADEEEIIMESAEMEFKDASKDYFKTTGDTLTLKNPSLKSSLPSTVWIPVNVKIIPTGIFDNNTHVNRVCFDTKDATGALATSALTTIKAGAFAGSAVSSIVIPNTGAPITIEEGAFSDSDLEKIDLGENVTTIKSTTFEGCSNLTDVIADKVTTIEQRAFSECTSLEIINFPEVTSVGNYAFKGCSKLSGLNGLFGRDKDHLSKLTSLGTGAFQGCGMTLIDLRYLDPSKVGSQLKASLFENCSKATMLYLPKQLEEIGKECFKGCSSLDTVVFTDIDKATSTKIRIGQSAFEGCSNLAIIDLQQSNVIENYAFSGCDKLKDIYLRYQNTAVPADNLKIDNYAFPLNDKVTIYGYEKTVEEYANFREYTFKSLKPINPITVTSNNSKVKATTDLKEAHEGDKVTITINVGNGCDVQSVEVSKVGGVGDSIDVENIENASNTSVRLFSFVMPDKAVSVSVKAVDWSQVGRLEASFTAVNGWGTSEDVSTIIEKRGNTYDLKQRGMSTQLNISGDGTPMKNWMFTYASSNTSVATIDEQGIIYGIKKGSATITATLKANKNKKISIPLTVENGQATTTYISSIAVNDNPVSTYGRKDGASYLDAKNNAVIVFNSADIKQSADTIKVDISAVAYGDTSEPSRQVLSYWSSADTSIATVAKATSNNNSNIINVKKGALGETQIKIYTLNDGEKTPNTLEKKPDGTALTPAEDNIRYVTIRVQDITPRIANDAITFNAQYLLGVPLSIVPVYKYQIGDDVELEVREYNSKTKTYDYKKGLTDLIKIEYDATNDTFYMKARENTREEMDAYGKFTPLYESMKQGGTLNFTKVGIHGTFSVNDTESEALTFDIPLKSIKITNQLPNPTIKMTGSINLFYKGKYDYEGTGVENNVPESNFAYIAQTTPKITTDSANTPVVTDGYLVSKENQISYGVNFKTVKTTAWDDFRRNFEIQVTHPDINGSLVTFDVHRTENDMVKDSANKDIVAGYIYLEYQDYRNPVMKPITIPNKTTAPNYAFVNTITGTANITANTNAQDQEYEFYFYDKADKTKWPIQLSHGTTKDWARLEFNEIKTTSGVFQPPAINKSTSIKADYDKVDLKLQTGKTPAKGTAVVNLHMYTWADDTKVLPYTVNLSVNNTLPTVTATPSTINVNEAYSAQYGRIQLNKNQNDCTISKLYDYDTEGHSGKYIKYMSYSGKASKTDAEVAANTLIGKFVNSTNFANFAANPRELDFEYDDIDLDDASNNVPMGTYTFNITPIIQYNGSGTEVNAKAVAFKIVVANNKPAITLGNATFTVNADASVRQDTASTTYAITNMTKDVNGNNTYVNQYSVNFGDYVPAKVVTPPIPADMKGTFTWSDSLSTTTKGTVTFENAVDGSVDKAVTYNYKTKYGNTTNKNTVEISLLDTSGALQTVKAYFNTMAFNICKKPMTPSITIAKSGTINLIDSSFSSAILLTPTVKNTTNTIKVSDISIKEYDANGMDYRNADGAVVANPHFVLDKTTYSDGRVRITAKDKLSDADAKLYGALIPGKSYNVWITYKLNNSDFTYTYKTTIVPTETFPSVKATSKSNYMYIGDVGYTHWTTTRAREAATIYGEYTVANSGVTMDGLFLDTSMSELIRLGFIVECKKLDGTWIVCDAKTPYAALKSTTSGNTRTYEYRIRFTGDPKAAIVQNKNYTLTLTPHYKNQVDEDASKRKLSPSKANITVNVRK